MSHLGSVMADALRVKYAKCTFSCLETYESLSWDDHNPIDKPSEEQIILDIADYKANKELYDYKILREWKYPSSQVLMLMIWESMDSGEIPKSNAFYTAIKAIHDKYPKPS